MKKPTDWLKKKLGTATLALSNVEKSALNQTNELMSSDINQSQRHTQGQVADSLINGEVTQEVMDLRWRTYKVLRETEGFTAEIVGYETDGTPIVKTVKKDTNKSILKIKVDENDPYPLEMVLDNTEIALDGAEPMQSEYLKLEDKPTLNYDDDGEVISATHGGLSAAEYHATNKTKKPITIEREFIPRFNLEKYTKKLNIRKIDEENRLLEFYVSVYPDPYDRSSRLFLSEIKKVILNPDLSNTFEMKSIDFISYKTLGTNDFLEYKYSDVTYDKIVEFNGFYIIKFKCKIIVNGRDIFEEHRQEVLDKKYENKDKK